MIADGRIAVVDQLRGLAAASVTWFHLTNGHHGWVAGTGAWGWLGVEAFFVISGFVIPHSLSRLPHDYKLRDFPRFLGRRILRLEPPYIASVLLVVVLDQIAASTPMFSGTPPHFELLQILAHLAYLIPLTNYTWIQPVYWTLAYEFVFYLTVGLTFPFLAADQNRWRGRVAAILVLVVVTFGAVSHLLALFVMGFAVHRHVAARDPRGLTLAFLALAVAAMIFRGALAEAAVGGTTALIILFHEAIPRLPKAAGAVLTGLGPISYSLYLVHVPIGGKIVNLGRRFISGDHGELALSLVAFATSLVVAIAFWRFIERPAISAAQRLRLQRQTAGSVTVRTST